MGCVPVPIACMPNTASVPAAASTSFGCSVMENSSSPSARVVPVTAGLARERTPYASDALTENEYAVAGLRFFTSYDTTPPSAAVPDMFASESSSPSAVINDSSYTAASGASSHSMVMVSRVMSVIATFFGAVGGLLTLVVL